VEQKGLKREWERNLQKELGKGITWQTSVQVSLYPFELVLLADLMRQMGGEELRRGG